MNQQNNMRKMLYTAALGLLIGTSCSKDTIFNEGDTYIIYGGGETPTVFGETKDGTANVGFTFTNGNSGKSSHSGKTTNNTLDFFNAIDFTSTTFTLKDTATNQAITFNYGETITVPRGRSYRLEEFEITTSTISGNIGVDADAVDFSIGTDEASKNINVFLNTLYGGLIVSENDDNVEITSTTLDGVDFDGNTFAKEGGYTLSIEFTVNTPAGLIESTHDVEVEIFELEVNNFELIVNQTEVVVVNTQTNAQVGDATTIEAQASLGDTTSTSTSDEVNVNYETTQNYEFNWIETIFGDYTEYTLTYNDITVLVTTLASNGVVFDVRVEAINSVALNAGHVLHRANGYDSLEDAKTAVQDWIINE